MINTFLYQTLALTTSPLTWDEECELADGSHFASNIQDYFEYIFLKNAEKTHSPTIRIYVNKTWNIITFRIRTGYYLNFF